MAEDAPQQGWDDKAAAADQARAEEIEQVTHKILFSRVMFLVGEIELHGRSFLLFRPCTAGREERITRPGAQLPR